MKNLKKIAPILFVCVCIAAAAVIGAAMARRNRVVEQQERPPAQPNAVVQEVEEPEWTAEIEYNGVRYRKRDNLKSILFMGVDNAKSGLDSDKLGNNGRTDTLILLIVDETEKSMQMLQISRDTYTDVDVYDNNGDYLYSGKMQITMQYSFGDSPTRGAFLTKRTLSEVLYGIDIDGYFSLTMDGITALTDAMGGIEVTIPEDYTDVDPAFVKGEKILLSGENAERILRYRDVNETGSNDVRMERQAWFVRQLVATLQKRSKSDISKLLDDADPYLSTDLSAEMMKELFSYKLSDEVLKVPGQTVLGDEGRDEYHVDNDALRELIIDRYYEPIE